MAYLSSVGIVHRDLAARNVLVLDPLDEVRLNVKLADFGSMPCPHDGSARMQALRLNGCARCSVTGVGQQRSLLPLLLGRFFAFSVRPCQARSDCCLVILLMCMVRACACSWMAPESLAHLKFTTASDVWWVMLRAAAGAMRRWARHRTAFLPRSYGVLLYEMVTAGATPFEELGLPQLLRRLNDGLRAYCLHGAFPALLLEALR